MACEGDEHNCPRCNSTGREDEWGRPMNGCRDCKHRHVVDAQTVAVRHYCRHPGQPRDGLEDERLRVDELVENASLPGSPVVVPGWCPLMATR